MSQWKPVLCTIYCMLIEKIKRSLHTKCIYEFRAIHRMLKLALIYELKTESLAFLMGIIETYENVCAKETLLHTSNSMCFIKSVCSTPKS